MYPQEFFWCTGNGSHKETKLEIVHSELRGMDTADPLTIVTFKCPRCKHEFLYKIHTSTIKQAFQVQKMAEATKYVK